MTAAPRGLRRLLRRPLPPTMRLVMIGRSGGIEGCRKTSVPGSHRRYWNERSTRPTGTTMATTVELPNADRRTATMRVAVAAAAACLVSATVTAGLDSPTTWCETLGEPGINDGPHLRRQHSRIGKFFDEDYEAKQLVGCGTFGMVMQCVSKKDGRMAAVKMIEDVNEIRDEVEREKEALRSIQHVGGHEHIVRFDGAYQHDGFHYIVTEYVEGTSLFALMQQQKQLGESMALQLTAQLASALAFLGTQGLIHRDLKPENIMIVQSGGDHKLKLIDFGSAEYLGRTESNAPGPKPAMALSGTRCYWPPEVLLGQATSPAMDMWALGCILFIMIAGRHPFDMMGTATEDEIVARVVSTDATGAVSFLHPIWATVSDDVKQLIRGLLERDPTNRLSVTELLMHPSLRSPMSRA